jgi:uncharacterized protein YbcI
MLEEHGRTARDVERLDAPPGEPLTGGELNAAVTKRVVQIIREHVGRGPTRARAFFRDNVLVVLLQDTMTQSERTLASSGDGQAVRELRRRIHTTMQAELVAAIETLTGCTVLACMNDCSLDPDLAVTLFVLDRQLLVLGDPQAGAIDAAGSDTGAGLRAQAEQGRRHAGQLQRRAELRPAAPPPPTSPGS